MNTERHPLNPFIPDNAKVLMLGSFPPKRDKWSMEFFYPNWINDMWRIIGHVFFHDTEHFILPGRKAFNKEMIESFCRENGIALFDTATEVKRLKDNASDKYLEVVVPTDIKALLAEMPDCQAIVATGQKAADLISETFACTQPRVGGMTTIELNKESVEDAVTMDNDKRIGTLHFWRMPSSSRAYPLKLDKKAAFYQNMFETEGLI